MKKSIATGLGCVAVALLLALKTCGKSGASDSPASASLATRKERAASAPFSPPPPVERTSSSKYEAPWRDASTGIERRTRKTLEMLAIPAVEMVGDEAIGTVTIKASEFGEIWRPETRAWGKMTPEEFKEWRGGALDKHAATATLVKSLDSKTKRPVAVRREAVGDGSPQPTASYNETESGINITLEWEGDKLRIKWASPGVDRQTEEVAIPFDPHYLD